MFTCFKVGKSQQADANGTFPMGGRVVASRPLEFLRSLVRALSHGRPASINPSDIARRTEAHDWVTGDPEDFRGMLPNPRELDPDGTLRASPGIQCWTSSSLLQSARTGIEPDLYDRDTRIDISRPIVQDSRLPDGHWAPPPVIRNDDPYGRGYPDVWWVADQVKNIQRPYLLRLDLARVEPIKQRSVEEELFNRRLSDVDPFSSHAPLAVGKWSAVESALPVELGIPDLPRDGIDRDMSAPELVIRSDVDDVMKNADQQGMSIPLCASVLKEYVSTEKDSAGGAQDGKL